MTHHPDCSIGIDLGGTNIKTALIDREGDIIARDITPTDSSEGVQAVVREIVDAVEATAGQGEIPVRNLVGVGVGAPAVSSDQGVVGLAPNLGWKDVPLRAILQDRLPVPVSVDNDASVAALAEARIGSGAGAASLFFITLGTGIGGGIVIRGKIHHGASFAAGEIGHVVIRPDGPLCRCGRKGCLEALSSGTAMIRDARAAIEAGRPSKITELANGLIRSVTPEMISRAARENDGLAREVFTTAAEHLGIAVTNIIHLLSPEVIAIGGGISEAGPVLFDPIQQTIGELTIPHMLKHTRVVKAQLGNDAGAIGAGLMMFGEGGG